ncbi:MAG TPA: DNA replication/repair protein RecF [Steroidobacteraceae bacterium]
MGIGELTVEDLRCLRGVQLVLHPRHNLLWGANGSGKTSLLEALFLLGRGRSFRTRNSERLIRHGGSQLTVFGRTDRTPSFAVGVQVSRVGGTVARINGAPAATLTELSQAFPVQVIDPAVHKLLEEGGHRRRRWLDWAVFHVEPQFGAAWTRYTRTLKQRNAALRQPDGDGAPWDTELTRWGESIAAWREQVMRLVQPACAQLVQRLSGLPVELHYRRGWPADLSLLEALQTSRDRDRLRGATQMGPHRADVLVRLDGRPAREVLSRGQQKLIAIALTLTPVELLADRAVTPTLLLDDPAAELDTIHLERFIAEVNRLPCQLLSTSLHARGGLFSAPDRVFHVEQGAVRPV